MIDDDLIAEIKRRKQYAETIEDHCERCRYEHVTLGMELAIVTEKESEKTNDTLHS